MNKSTTKTYGASVLRALHQNDCANEELRLGNCSHLCTETTILGAEPNDYQQ